MLVVKTTTNERDDASRGHFMMGVMRMHAGAARRRPASYDDARRRGPRRAEPSSRPRSVAFARHILMSSCPPSLSLYR